VQPDRIEPARAQDAALLAAMAREYVEDGLRPGWSAARIGWHMRDADSLVLTARSDRSIAGFAIMRYADDSAHLNLLAVAPPHRRRGVGRRLIRWLEETAITAGTFRIGLELRARNETARAFYRTLGYSELDQIPGYYQGVESAIRMARDLRAQHAAAPGAPQRAP